MLFLLLKAWNLNQWLCRWKTEFQIILQAWKKHEKSLSNYVYDLQLLFFLHFICTLLSRCKRKEIAKLFPFFLSYNTIRSSQRPPSIVRWNCFSFIYGKAVKSQWLRGYVNLELPENFTFNFYTLQSARVKQGYLTDANMIGYIPFMHVLLCGDKSKFLNLRQFPASKLLARLPLFPRA